jgi:hypothetical protein
MQRFPHGATLRPPFVRPGAGYGRRTGAPGPQSARPQPLLQHPAGRALGRPADERGTAVA